MSLYWSDAVYDRTTADVEEARRLLEKGFSNMTETERSKFLSGLKGSLNVSDIERIVNNINIILLTLEAGEQISIDTNNPLNESVFADILDRLTLIWSMNIKHSTTPKVPSIPINTFEKVNDIEHLLNDVYEILMSNFFYYCGDGLYAGGEVALLL